MQFLLMSICIYVYSFVSPTLPSINDAEGHNSDPEDDEDDASIQHSKASKVNTSISQTDGTEENTRRSTRKRTPPTLFSFPTTTATTSHSSSSSSSSSSVAPTLSSHRAAVGAEAEGGAGDGVGELRYLFCLQIEDSTGSADVMVYDKVSVCTCMCVFIYHVVFQLIHVHIRQYLLTVYSHVYVVKIYLLFIYIIHS